MVRQMYVNGEGGRDDSALVVATGVVMLWGIEDDRDVDETSFKPDEVSEGVAEVVVGDGVAPPQVDQELACRTHIRDCGARD